MGQSDEDDVWPTKADDANAATFTDLQTDGHKCAHNVNSVNTCE